MDYCANLEVIPQFAGTCWFNAILMICLYSDGVSRIFRETSIRDNWDKSDDGFKVALFNILSYINRIKLSYDNLEKQKAYNIKLNKYLNKINPEVLLLDFINKYDKSLKKLFIKDNKLNSTYNISLGYSFKYIVIFFNILKINYIDIYVNYDNKESLLDMGNFLKTEEDIILKLKSSPEIIYYTDNILENYDYDYDYEDIYNTENYDLNLIDLMDYKDIVNINGCKYKLDSIGVANYNDIDYDDTSIKHIIAGITCNNNKYVYNGWFSESTDKAIQKTIEGFNNSPCNLMKYDWNIRKNEEFCLNINLCKLDFENIDKKDLCFSFAKGTRYLIYTKIRNDKEDLYTTSLAKTSINISKIKKDVFNKKFHPELDYIKSVSISSSSSISKSLNKKEYIIPYIIENNINIPEEIIKEIEDKEFLKIYGIKTKLNIDEIKKIVKNKHKRELLNILTMEQLIRILDLSEKSLSLLSIDTITKDKIINLILTNKIKLTKEILEKFDEDLLNNILCIFKFKTYEYLNKIKNLIKNNNKLLNFIILNQLTVKDLNDLILNKSFKSSKKEILIYKLAKDNINVDKLIKYLDNNKLLLIYVVLSNNNLYDNSNKIEILELLHENDLKDIIIKNDLTFKITDTKDDLISIILKAKIAFPLVYLNDYTNISFFIKSIYKSQQTIIIEIDDIINNINDKIKKDNLNKLTFDILNKLFEQYKEINREYLLKLRLLKQLTKFSFDKYYDIIKETIPEIFIKICKNIYMNNDRYKRKLLKELSEEELLNLIEFKFNIKNKKEMIKELLEEKIEIEKILKIKPITILDNYKSFILNPLNKNKILKLLEDDDINELLKIYK